MRLELEKKQEKEEESRRDGWMENERLQEQQQQQQQQEQANLLRETRNEVNFPSYGPLGVQPGPSFTDLPAREDSLDLYAFREEWYGEGGPDRGKPGFPESRFPDASYAQTSSNQYAQPYQGNFADFGPVFGGQYGGYGEFGKEGGYQQGGYECFTSGTAEGQYTSLNPVGGGGKIESFSELLNGRYYPEYEDAVFNHPGDGVDRGQKGEQSTSGGAVADECGENFGEIIKKSIVETTSA